MTRKRIKSGTAPSTLNALGHAILERVAGNVVDDMGELRQSACEQPVDPPGAKARRRAEKQVVAMETVLVSTQEQLDELYGKGTFRMPEAATQLVLGRARYLPEEARECDRYLGVDPGLASLGIFVLGLTPTSVRCLHRETFTTTPAHGTDDQRLRLIAQRIDELYDFWLPNAVGYEDVRSITTGKETRRTGHSDSGPLMMVCGMLIQAAWQHGDVPCYRVATTSARVAVLGKGNSRGATKKTVRDRLQQITGTQKLTLDQGDAGAIAFGAYVKHVSPPPKPKRKRK